MTSVRCLDCAKFSFDRAGAEWSRKGLGCCALHIPATKYDPVRERDCGGFEKSERGVVEKRERWMREVKSAMESGVCA